MRQTKSYILAAKEVVSSITGIIILTSGMKELFMKQGQNQDLNLAGLHIWISISFL